MRRSRGAARRATALKSSREGRTDVETQIHGPAGVALLTGLFLAAATGLGLPIAMAQSTQTFPLDVTHGSTAFKARMPLLDINRATKEELALLKGIGSSGAAAIIKGRPYASEEELLRRGIIPSPAYDAIRWKIIAKLPR